MGRMKSIFHVNWNKLKVGDVLISSDRGGYSFHQQILFIKAKREQIIEFDIITISKGYICLQYDDWATKNDWEEEVHLSGVKIDSEMEHRFMWQFFHFGFLDGDDPERCRVVIRTKSELSKIPLEEVEAREIENEKRRNEEEDESRSWMYNR